MPAETLLYSKQAISKIIVWTSSRYNARRKSDVMKDIIFGLQHGYRPVICWKEQYTPNRFHITEEITNLGGKERVLYHKKYDIFDCGTYTEAHGGYLVGPYIVDYRNKRILVADTNHYGKITKIKKEYKIVGIPQPVFYDVELTINDISYKEKITLNKTVYGEDGVRFELVDTIKTKQSVKLTIEVRQYNNRLPNITITTNKEL